MNPHPLALTMPEIERLARSGALRAAVTPSFMSEQIAALERARRAKYQAAWRKANRQRYLASNRRAARAWRERNAV